MSVTIFGEYFHPMPIWMEVLYYVCMAVAVVVVCRSLYLAVRVPGKPADPRRAQRFRSSLIRRSLFRAAKVSALCGLFLILLRLLW